MNTLFKVRVRYCGGCNPEIDRGETVEQIEKLMKGRAEFTHDSQARPDVTLHVCGCAHACLDEENEHPGPEPVVSVQGLRVNRHSVKPEEIFSLVSEKLIEAAEAYQRRQTP
ncbi:MAG: hypothetical protein ACOC7W_03975 [Desulfosalsimonas sp.]